MQGKRDFIFARSTEQNESCAWLLKNLDCQLSESILRPGTGFGAGSYIESDEPFVSSDSVRTKEGLCLLYQAGWQIQQAVSGICCLDAQGRQH